MRSRLLVVCALLAGCDLYWGGGNNGDDVCNGYTIPAVSLRDPETGICLSSGGGYVPCCTGNCPEQGGGAARDWAVCHGSCDGLSESACTATSGCLAAYLDDGGVPAFWGCFGTVPSGPIEGGTCAGLNAEQCSEHDDCGIVYAGANNNTKFERCIAEPGALCLADGECGGGARCDTTTCHQLPCPDCPTCGACADTCYGVCVPAIDACTGVDCGPGYTCAEQCDAASANLVGACHPVCMPGHDPGLCYATVTCATPPPACPSGTLPGIANGCYTGYCIPIASCELAACATLATEQACTARADCTPVYSGTNCTCTPAGCECQTLTYERCETPP